MKLIQMAKVREGRYLKNYELTYENKAGKEKVYEIVSFRNLNKAEELGERVTGLSIVAICGGKMLLLKEFRMGVNERIFNLCAGMLEKGETIEECIRRELYEETGLSLKKIIRILPPSYAAVAITDIKNQIVFAEVEGTISEEHTSDNEDIQAALYSRQEVNRLLETETFSSRAQIAAYMFSIGALDVNTDNAAL